MPMPVSLSIRSTGISNELYIVKEQIQDLLDKSTSFKFAFDALLQSLDFDKIEVIEGLNAELEQKNIEILAKVDYIETLERENVQLKIDLDHAKGDA